MKDNKKERLLRGERNGFGQELRGAAELGSWSSTGQRGESGGSTSGNCSEAMRKRDQELSGQGEKLPVVMVSPFRHISCCLFRL